MFQFREANENDRDVAYCFFAEVQSLHADALPNIFRPPENRQMFMNFFANVLEDPDKKLVFACADEDPIGCVLYSFHHRHEDVFTEELQFARIDQLVVAAEDRRAGCATKLIEYVVGEANKRGTKRLDVDHWSFNEAARACFENAGFKIARRHLSMNL